MAKIIKHQLFFPNPPAVVWEYLTDPELIAQWLMKSNFKPILGHEFEFRINPMPQLNFDGIFYCKVLDIIPFEKLSYSWKFGPGDGTLNDSEVTWTLKEIADGTELELVHRGFGDTGSLPMFAGLADGWIKNMQKMLQKIKTATDGPTEA